MTMILSPSMMDALVTMLEIKFSVDFSSTTLRALERRGLAKWYPYSKPEKWVKDGCWKLTTLGKRAAQEIAQAQASDRTH